MRCPGRRTVAFCRRAPALLHAFEVESGNWHMVDNPGITAWESLTR